MVAEANRAEDASAWLKVTLAAVAAALDVEYVDRRSFRLDVSILAKTIPYVLLRKDTNTDVHNSNSDATASH